MPNVSSIVATGKKSTVEKNSVFGGRTVIDTYAATLRQGDFFSLFLWARRRAFSASKRVPFGGRLKDVLYIMRDRNERCFKNKPEEPEEKIYRNKRSIFNMPNWTSRFMHIKLHVSEYRQTKQKRNQPLSIQYKQFKFLKLAPQKIQKTNKQDM